MSIVNKHCYKTFAENYLSSIKTLFIHIDASPASLLYCIENNLNPCSRKCPDSLAMAPLSCTKSAGLCTALITNISNNNSVSIS